MKQNVTVYRTKKELPLPRLAGGFCRAGRRRRAGGRKTKKKEAKDVSGAFFLPMQTKKQVKNTFKKKKNTNTQKV